MNFNFKTDNSILVRMYERDGQKLKLWIDADVLTPRALREINEGIKSEITVQTGMQMEVANTAATCKTLDLLLTKWKAVDASGAESDVEMNGQVVEPTFEFFDSVSIKFCTDLLIFCMGEINPKPTTDTSSGGGTRKAVG